MKNPEFRLFWKFVRSCLGKLGSINKDSTWLKYLEVASQLKEDYSQFALDWSFQKHNGQNWKRLPIEYTSFYKFVFLLLEKSHLTGEELPTTFLQDFRYFQLKTDQYQVFWKKTINGNIENVRIHQNGYETFIELIKNLADQYLGNQISINLFTKDGMVSFDILPDKFLFVENQLGKDLAEKIIKYNSCGLGRTVLFYGPPGTGKSNLAKSISKELGVKTLSISNLENFFISYNTMVDEILDFLHIKCIILDDLDSLPAGKEDIILKKLEELRNSGKTILGTANAIKTLKASFIRPGRFDEVREIKYLDPAVVMNMVEGDKELYDVIYQYPAANIQELMNRVKVLGKEAALAEIDDIILRGQVLNEADYQLK